MAKADRDSIVHYSLRLNLKNPRHLEIHKILKLNKELMIFEIDGVLLDTKEKHYDFLINFSKNINYTNEIIQFSV